MLLSMYTWAGLAASGGVVERAGCGHCGTWEECAMEYTGWFQERFGGCGLCEEASKALGVGSRSCFEGSSHL